MELMDGRVRIWGWDECIMYDRCKLGHSHTTTIAVACAANNKELILDFFFPYFLELLKYPPSLP